MSGVLSTVMGKVHVLDHPLVQNCMAVLRDRTASRALVRQQVRAVAGLLFYEATRDLPCQTGPVATPLGEATVARIACRVGLVPVLRAGLGMVDSVLELHPDAQVFHLGLFRDERTLEAVEYYNKLTHHRPVAIAFVLDPMLATGGSACAACARLKAWGVNRIKFLGIFAAPAGVAALTTAHPDVEIYVGALDPQLNDRGYIVPGMGDAGDRQFSAE